MRKPWIALYSQTGSEIVSLSEYRKQYPDIIITDNNTRSNWHPKLLSHSVSIIDKKNRKNSYVLKNLFDPAAIITLHGWLNIIPQDICEKYSIFNGHPGYIVDYPELKGKDPQKRCWENIHFYDKVGSVVHKVSPEVDNGEIIASECISSALCTSLEATFNTLKTTSLKAWIKAFDIIQ